MFLLLSECFRTPHNTLCIRAALLAAQDKLDVTLSCRFWYYDQFANCIFKNVGAFSTDNDICTLQRQHGACKQFIPHRWKKHLCATYSHKDSYVFLLQLMCFLLASQHQMVGRWSNCNCFYGIQFFSTRSELVMRSDNEAVKHRINYIIPAYNITHSSQHPWHMHFGAVLLEK